MRLALLSLFLLVFGACAGRGRPATLETDGAWVHRYAAAGEDVYHASVAAFTARGWSIEHANPLSRSFQAKSPVRARSVPFFGSLLRYKLARVDVEGEAQGSRLRLKMISTHEPEGAGRRPNNDRAVENETLYESLLADIGNRLGSQ